MEDRKERPGRFVFHDLMTNDSVRSATFYRSLFPEWDVQDVDLGEAGTYHIIRVGGMKCGGIVPVDLSSGLAAHWIGYVEVTDCGAATECAVAEGGHVPVPTMDVPGIGKFAVVMDRQDAILKALEPAVPIELPSEPASGQFYWNELLTTDVPSARSFYQSVFGWSAIEIDGNDMQALVEALEASRARDGRPKAIIMRTQPGRGISTLEKRERAHFVRIPDEEWQAMRDELEAGRPGGNHG